MWNPYFQGLLFVCGYRFIEYELFFPGHVYSVINTSNIDAALFSLYVIFHTETTTRNVVLNSDEEPFRSLRRAFAFVETDGWDEARLHWLTSHNLLPYHPSNEYDMYGSIDANVLNFIKNPMQLYKTSSLCSRLDCPVRERTTINTNLALE